MVKNQKKSRRAVYWTLFILWLILLVFLSRQTGEETVKQSGSITEFLCRLSASIGIRTDPASIQNLIRRAAHVVIYLVLCFLLCRAFRFSFRGVWLLPTAIALCMAIGVLDEYQKAFIPGRHLHWNDVLLNCVSTVPGALIGWFAPGKSKTGSY